MIPVITQTTAERDLEFTRKYNQYLDLYYNTGLNISEILKQLDISERSSLHKQIRKKMKEEGHHDAMQRRHLVQKGEWLNQKKQ